MLIEELKAEEKRKMTKNYWNGKFYATFWHWKDIPRFYSNLSAFLFQKESLELESMDVPRYGFHYYIPNFLYLETILKPTNNLSLIIFYMSNIIYDPNAYSVSSNTLKNLYAIKDREILKTYEGN